MLFRSIGKYTYKAKHFDYPEHTADFTVSNNSETIMIVMTDEAMNIPEELKSELVIYPNPAQNFIWVKGITDCEIRIFDMAGRIVINRLLHSDYIDLSKLNEGTYIIQFRKQQKTWAKKIMIVR